MGLTLSAPAHSAVSRRAVRLPGIRPAPVPHGPLYVLIDSTGLQVYGAGQWLEAKHGAKSRCKWRKTHLAVEAASDRSWHRRGRIRTSTIRPRPARCSIRLTIRLFR
jgi:hypothetical protein